ncbi:MAG: Fic family protein [Coriobacteriales bacterium]|jgi:Fic family protein|nr:Fic family protein [Coriobacteriales bacterium]
MAEYISLQKLHNQNKSSDRWSIVREEANKRLNAESSYRTGIEIATGEIFLAMPTQLSTLSERLLRVERKVSHLWRDLPRIAKWAYFRGLIIDEMVSTNETEGIHSTRRQIADAMESALSQTTQSPNQKTKRFTEFAKLYLQLTDENPIYPRKPSDIRIIYDAVMAGELKEDEQPDGEFFRKESIDIVASHKTIHRGIVPEAKIISMLEQMIHLVDSSGIPPLFSAVISHFLFEYIHPFYDGNGRTGRYLLALYLGRSLSLTTVMSMSRTIAENKNKYYRSFERAENPLNQAELTFFVIQMLEFIRTAQDYAIEDLENKTSMLSQTKDTLHEKLEKAYDLTIKETSILYMVIQQHLFDVFSEITLADIVENSSMQTQTARNQTLKLVEKGILQQISLRPLRFKLTEKVLKELSISDVFI